jgi:hypothetical protein
MGGADLFADTIEAQWQLVGDVHGMMNGLV